MSKVIQKQKRRKTATPERLAKVIRPRWRGDIDRAIATARELKLLAIAAPGGEGIPRARDGLSSARAEVTRALLTWLRTSEHACVPELDECGKQVHLALLALKDLWWLEQVLYGLELKRGIPVGDETRPLAEVIPLHAHARPTRETAR